MAILKDEADELKEAQQAKFNRQKQKEKRLREQGDVLVRREEFGEAWKLELSKAQREKYSQELGEIETPSLYGFEDINEYFDPIKFYGKQENEDLTAFSYPDYFGALDTYKDQLKKINLELAKDNQFLAQFEEAEIDETELEEITDLKELKKKVKEKTAEAQKAGKAKKIKAPQFLHKLLAKWTTYFQSVVPVYDKYVCSCCGRPLKMTEFYKTYDETHLAHINYSGNLHTHVCKKCTKKVYEYLFFEKANNDSEIAMKWLCSYLNLYFSSSLFLEAQANMRKGGNKTHIVEEYMKLINDSLYVGKVFLDSPDVGIGKSRQSENKQLMEGMKTEWTKDEIEARRLVLKMTSYDPFSYEEEEDRKALYKDLIGMLDSGMEYDVLKVSAAIEIVQSFLKIRKINKKYNEIEKNGGSVAELKALSDLKNKELTSITNFSRDNGFGERYAISKAKGENTFTGIINQMNERKFEDALINVYDIATSESIAQAAEASTQAIFNQLGIGEAEIYKTCQDQLKRLVDLEHKNSSLTEEVRKLKYEIAKKQLEEKAEEAEAEKESRWDS